MSPRRARRAVIVVALLLWLPVVFGAIDIEAPSDPQLAARYRALIAELRCPKCLNQNIAGSDSPISADLRRTVRELLEEGRTPAEIRAYLVERYGDFILYRPRLTAGTLFLWAGPGVVFGLALAVGVGFVLRRRPVAVGAEGVATGSDVDAAAVAAARRRLAGVNPSGTLAAAGSDADAPLQPPGSSGA